MTARTDPWSIDTRDYSVATLMDLGSADLLNLSGQYTFGETNRISRLKISGCVLLVRSLLLVSASSGNRPRRRDCGPLVLDAMRGSVRNNSG